MTPSNNNHNKAVIVESNGELPSRAVLRRARRVCIKAGTSVIANPDGQPSLTRLGALVEQICELHALGIQVIFISSGAVGMGKRVLRRQSKMLMSLKDIRDGGAETSPSYELLTENHHFGRKSSSADSLLELASEQSQASEKEQKNYYDSACAAAGQFELMNLYSSLFTQCDVAASQLLVTQTDFIDEAQFRNLCYAVERLLSLDIVPIVNENDASSVEAGTAVDVFTDNDSLAAICARNFGAEVLLLLTDVEGVYDRPPKQEGAKLLPFYKQDTTVAIGEKSSQGRGGMASKIDAALKAVQPGSNCGACVVASGNDLNCVRALLGTKSDCQSPGTLFCTPGSELEKQAIFDMQATQQQSEYVDYNVSDEARSKATSARAEARKLLALPYSVRQDILRAIADALMERKQELLAANANDLEVAEQTGTSTVLKKRLNLTEAKLSTLASGLRQIADLPDPLGVVKSKRELSEGLELSLTTVPIGVLMVIFESRPDSMPQISALALASGNGLLLKGGKEATHSNLAIHTVIGDAIEKGSGGQIKRDIIALVTSRGQVADMLQLDDVIDLIIPRGSNELVSYIKANTRIPVLGHADGVCHVYIDASADADAASKIAVDAKTDYPSACNAMETLLLDRSTIENGVANATLTALRMAGVRCLGGPTAMKLGLCDTPAEGPSYRHEYGDLVCTVAVVENMSEAIDWIHAHGSGHTEAIVTTDEAAAEDFLQRVDAACVFSNASTRFADGYRFGLGAEVGISTGRIHARGPVGVEGLLTTKYQLRSLNKDGSGQSYEPYTVADFAGDAPKRTYTHKELKV